MPLSEQDLIRELRAIRPEPDPEFGARLDEWAAAGFPSRQPTETPTATPKRRRSGLRLSLPKLAFAASMIVVVGTISLGVLSEEMGSDDSGGLSELPVEDGDGSAVAPRDGNGAEATIEPAPGPVGIEPTPVPAGGDRAVRPSEGQLLPGRDRIQQRDARMTLSTDPDEVAQVADGVVEVTERYGGIVVSSNVNTSAERGRASFDLRIPTANLQAALADLSDLASVKERSEGSLDITAPYIGASERFANARAEVGALLAQLADAGSADEIAQVREQLRVARGELASARAELADLKRRTDFSQVAVTVVGDGDADGWSLGDAADDALSVLEDLTGAALIALAVILPLLLIAAIAWWLYAMARRALRERALDD